MNLTKMNEFHAAPSHLKYILHNILYIIYMLYNFVAFVVKKQIKKKKN